MNEPLSENFFEACNQVRPFTQKIIRQIAKETLDPDAIMLVLGLIQAHVTRNCVGEDKYDEATRRQRLLVTEMLNAEWVEVQH